MAEHTRSFGIPAVTALGVTLTGCADLSGGWEMSRFAGLALPVAGISDPLAPEVVFGGSGSLSVSSEASGTLTLAITYQYASDYGTYTYTLPLSYGVGIQTTARRRYTIDVTLDELFTTLLTLYDGPISDERSFEPQRTLECSLDTPERLLCADQELAAWDFER